MYRYLFLRPAPSLLTANSNFTDLSSPIDLVFPQYAPSACPETCTVLIVPESFLLPIIQPIVGLSVNGVDLTLLEQRANSCSGFQ